MNSQTKDCSFSVDLRSSFCKNRHNLKENGAQNETEQNGFRGTVGDSGLYCCVCVTAFEH